jgi:hypothetical protein
MKRLLLIVAVALAGIVIISRPSAAQCEKCSSDWADMEFSALDEGPPVCWYGPLAPPRYEHCELHDGHCDNWDECVWTNESNLALTPLGTAYAIPSSSSRLTSGSSIFRACSGVVVAFAYSPEDERDVRTGTNHVVI